MKILLLLLLTVAAQNSFAVNPACFELFNITKRGGSEVPWPKTAQLIYWDQYSNLARFQKPLDPIQLSFAHVPKTSVDSLILSGQDSVQRFLETSDFLFWPKHPWNTDVNVPFYRSSTALMVSAHFSSSRAVYVEFYGKLYSLSLPTDSPHRKPDDREPTKADLSKDSIVALQRSQSIKSYDEKNGLSEDVQVLYDVASFREKQSGNGFVVSDFTPLQDGHYYFPAFSIPYEGLDIARQNQRRVSVQEFWRPGYAQALGRAKALLLLRYGLQLTDPHAEKFLLQLDQTMNPTGKVYIRGIKSSEYVNTIAQALGLESEMGQDQSQLISVTEHLNPRAANSFALFKEAGVQGDVINDWQRAHDLSYIQTLVKELHLEDKTYSLAEIEAVLFSSRGIRAVKNYGK